MLVSGELTPVLDLALVAGWRTARWVGTARYCWGRGGQFSYSIVSSNLSSLLDSREPLGDFLESFDVVITVETFSGEREVWWSEAEPAEVE